jgi:hypothetical protein
MLKLTFGLLTCVAVALAWEHVYVEYCNEDGTNCTIDESIGVKSDAWGCIEFWPHKDNKMIKWGYDSSDGNGNGIDVEFSNYHGCFSSEFRAHAPGDYSRAVDKRMSMRFRLAVNQEQDHLSQTINTASCSDDELTCVLSSDVVVQPGGTCYNFKTTEGFNNSWRAMANSNTKGLLMKFSNELDCASNDHETYAPGSSQYAINGRKSVHVSIPDGADRKEERVQLV